MGKKYNNVTEMMHDIADDKEFADDLEKHISERMVIKQLVAMRTARGISQAEVAEKMNCTQSKISKFESGTDSEISLGDLDGYLEALGLAGTILATKKGQGVVDDIKYHFQCLGKALDRLLELAHNDADIAVGVGKFSNEIAVNFFSRIAGFVANLPAEAIKQHSAMTIEVKEVDCEQTAPRAEKPSHKRPALS